MSDWEELKGFKCTRCSKIFFDEQPVRCTCRSPYEKGLIIGPFLISGDKVNGDVPVICLLCDMSRPIHYTAIRRQQSCGCKPRHISILEITKESVRYMCKKCSKIVAQDLPVFSYCCEELSEDD